MSSLKLRCFQHYLFESNHFLCVVTELHFWRSLLPKTCFGFFCNYIGSSKLYITENQQFGFIVAKCAAWSFMAPRICFASLTTTLSFLELYITKKKAFLLLFFVAETRWNQLYSRKSIFRFVCHKIVLLPALLHLEKIFFQFAAKLPWFLLHFTQNNVFYLCLAKWHCFRIPFLRTTFTSVFVTKLHFWFSILLEKYFGLLATKLDYLWAVYHIKPAFACWQEDRAALSFISQKKCFAFSSLKHARLSFIAQKTYSGLFAIILGCFRCYCTKKWFSSSMQGVILIFTWFYSNNGFPFFWLSYTVSELSFWGKTCSLFP